MNYTQAQIDRANAVSLEDFLRTQGETLIKSGREYRWKEHDSLTVRGNKWFRHSQSKGGYPIDFVMEFYGKSFSEAVQLLTGESGEGQTEATTAPPTAFHLTVFFLNARTPEKCSSALTATPQEVKPAPGWNRTFPARSPSFALSRQGKTGTMFSVSKGTFRAANS